MTQQFISGDVVKMKSGGPEMTVEEVINDRVHCSWFDKNTLIEKDFNINLLIKHEPVAEDIGFMLSR